jgi:hypothetical protein
MKDDILNPAFNSSIRPDEISFNTIIKGCAQER